LRSIQTREVAEFLDGIDKPNMAKLVRKTLYDMMRIAETKGMIDTGKNPVTVTRTPEIEVERSRLTLEQFRAIYKEAGKMEPWVARSFELALLTGQRREDVANMLFADAKDGFLFVEQQKTKMRLRIPLAVRMDALGLSLDDVIKRCRDKVVSKSMIHHARTIGNQKPGYPIDPDSLTRGFRLARTEAKIKWEDGKKPASFHELRSLAARLYADQYSPEFAQAIMGHKSASMTEMYRDVRGSEWVEVKLAV
jgi:integrase